jgi:hypothetical protein
MTLVIDRRGRKWLPAAYEDWKRERAAIKALVQAVKENDVQRFFATFSEHCDGDSVLRPAFKQIARLSPPSRRFQKAIINILAECGDSLRQEIGDDLLLCDALRVLLPPYKGPAPLRLYRGEPAVNRKRRTYGASWSRDRVAAECFARDGFQRAAKGGTVLLETDAPAQAIVAFIDGTRFKCEEEVIIDRRCLNSVRVLARYPQRERL